MTYPTQRTASRRLLDAAIAYLRDSADDDVVGEAGKPFDCPLACAMNNAGMDDGCVFDAEFYWHHSPNYTAPGWAREFISRIDWGRVRGAPVTARRAREALCEVSPRAARELGATATAGE